MVLCMPEANQKSIRHKRKSTADLHLTRPCHKKKEEAMKKVKQPESGIAPTASLAPASAQGVEGPVTPRDDLWGSNAPSVWHITWMQNTAMGRPMQLGS